MENMRRQLTSTEIETMIKNLPTKKPRAKRLHRWILLKVQRRWNTHPLKLFQKITERGIQFHSTRPPSCWYQNQAKISLKKENYRPMWLTNIDAKIFSKILANRIRQSIKRIIYHDQVNFMPGMKGFFILCKSINVIQHTDKLKVKTNVIISTNAKKSFNKIQHLLKNSPEDQHRRNLSQHNKGHIPAY